jgi:hypothetical protein
MTDALPGIYTNMMFRRILITVALACPLLAGGGCSGDTKSTDSASAGPSRQSADPAERAEAVKEAAKKYGGSAS